MATPHKINLDRDPKAPIRVLIFGLHWGSHFKNQKELAEWLMTETHEDGSPVYDLSMLVWRSEIRVEKAENLHLIYHPEDCPMTDA